MNSLEYSFKCPSCSQVYSKKEYRSSRLPRILQCGHTCCEVCIQSRSAQSHVCICPVCKASQAVPDGTSIKDMLLDCFVLGSQSHFGRDLSSWFVYKNGEAFGTSAVGPATGFCTEESKRIACDECGERAASCRCDTCPANYCTFCFEQAHRSARTTRRHKPRPLQQTRSLGCRETVCKEHGRALEFFCNEDSVAVCSFCVVMGGHRQHTVVAVTDQNKAAMLEIEPALEEALKSIQALKKSDKKLEKIRFSVSSYFQIAADSVVSHFHHLVGLLQLRCQQLLQEIKKASTEYDKDLCEKAREISAALREFEALQKEVMSALSSSNDSYATCILRKLRAFQDLPCIILNDPRAYRPVEQMEFDPSLPEALRTYGDIQFSESEKLSVVKLSDVPENYAAAEGDDTDTESSSSCYDNGTREGSSQQSGSMAESEDTSNGATSLDMHDTLNNKRVVVSHIRNPCHFYVQLHQMMSKLHQMQREINECCSSSPASSAVEDVQVGKTYLAQFGMDHNWYRCRVLRSESSAVDIVDSGSLRQSSRVLAEIFYVDYGNSEIVPVTKLRHMLPRFQELLPMALRCSLYNLVPAGGRSTWKKDAIRMFAKLTVNRNLILKEMERLPETLFVDLLYEDGEDRTSVSDALVFQELACFHMPDIRALPNRVSLSRRQYYPPLEFHSGQLLKVLVCAIEDPHRVYVQELGSNIDYLQNMSQELQEYCEASKSEVERIYVPSVGMVCLAQYSLDKQWYRASVVSLPGGCKVEVAYVDYGNRETVPVTSVLRIPDRFMKLPSQAIPVQMVDMRPFEGDTWSKQAKDLLIKLTSNKVLYMRVHSVKEGELPGVSLFIPGKRNQDICLNAMLVKEKVAACTGPTSLIVEVPGLVPPQSAEPQSLVGAFSATAKMVTQMKKRAQQHGEKSTMTNVLLAAVARQAALPSPEKTPFAPPPHTALQGPGEGYIPVLISYLEAPTNFFVRRLAEEPKWQKLLSEIQEQCSQPSTCAVAVPEWQAGQWCVVHYSGSWQRGKVLTVADEMEVHLVDVGEKMAFPVTSLAPLPMPFTAVPPFAQRCHLAEIIPAGGNSSWSKTSMECFDELVCRADAIYLQEMGSVVDGSLPVDLVLEHIKPAEALEPMKRSYRSVRETLKEKGYAFFPKMTPKVKASKPTSVQPPVPGAAMPPATAFSHSYEKPTSPHSSSERPSSVAKPTSTKGSAAEGSSKCQENCISAQERESFSSNEENVLNSTPDTFRDAPSPTEFVGGESSAQKNVGDGQLEVGNKEEERGVGEESEEGSEDRYGLEKEDLPLLLQEEPVFQWEKREFPAERQMMVMPTHVDEQAVIYVQVLGEDIKIYKDMKAELNRVYTDRPPPQPRTLKKGQACIARYAADHMFYRAEVKGVARAGIEVQFVDYGTIEVVSADSLFTDIMFEDIPVLCLEVELFGLKPFSVSGAWPLAVLDGIHFTIVEHNCSMVVKERPMQNTRAKVHLFLPDGVALHDFLLETGQACRDESCNMAPTQGGEGDPEQDCEDFKWPYPHYTPPREGVFPVVVTHLQDYNLVCIQLDRKPDASTAEEERINRTLQSFLEMMKELSQLAHTFPPLKDPALGMACCGQYTYDDTWYRCMVTGTDGANVSVLYVDYGNSETVTLGRLRVLPDKYTAIPMQALTCRLHGIEPVADARKIVRVLIDVLFENSEVQFYARIKDFEGEVMEIDLLDSTMNLVYRSLADQNLISIVRNA